jgi:hypothetical protein
MFTLDQLLPSISANSLACQSRHRLRSRHKEFFSIDSWDNLENIQKLYSDPNLAAEFGKLFEGMPDIAIWAESGWLEY